MKRILITLLLTLSLSVAFAATVGQTIPQVTIKDANNAPVTIPDLGKKVLAIFINDPDAADLNDKLADKLKAADLDLAHYRGIGIATLSDTVLPDSVIRAMIRRKIEKYDSTILTDTDGTLSKSWGLGSTNGTSIVLIVDKKGVVRYQKRGSLTAAEVDSTLQLVLELMAQ